MNIRFINEFASLWTTNNVPILFCKFHRPDLSTGQFSEINTALLRVVKNYQLESDSKIYCVCDASTLPTYSFELMISLETRSLPLQLDAGLAFKAFVMPDKNCSLKTLIEAEKAIDHLPAAIFRSSVEASKYLARHINQKLAFC